MQKGTQKLVAIAVAASFFYSYAIKNNSIPVNKAEEPFETRSEEQMEEDELPNNNGYSKSKKGLGVVKKMRLG